MILMWLGSFVLMMFGLTESQKQIAHLFSNFQKSFLDKGLETTFGKMLVRSLDVAVLEASPQKSLYSGLALYNLRVLGLRASILLMCLSTIGAWWALILGLLFLSFNGFFLLGLCALGLLNVGEAPRLKAVIRWLFATGVFLIGGEMMLRNSSVVLSLLGQSELAFIMADGRFGAVLGMVLAGLVISLFVQIEFWSLVLGLGLLVTNTLSFNGALGFVVGERIARMLLFWWRSRGLDQDSQRIGRQLPFFSILGVIVGFLIAGELRTLLNFGFSSDMTALQDRSLQFVLLFSVILFFQFVAQMTWGHFACRVKVGEREGEKYFPDSWTQQELLSLAVLSWANEKTQSRSSTKA